MNKHLDLVHFNAIESSCNEAVLLQAEDIIDTPGSILIKARDEKMWSIEVSFKSQIHTIQIRHPRNRIFDRIHCNCHIFSPKSVCPHAIAAMIQLRKLITAEEKNVSIIEPSKRTKNKSTFEELLTQSTKDDLAALIKRHSSRSKKFKLETAMHLIRSLDSDVAPEQFKSFLEVMARDLSTHKGFSRSNRNFCLSQCQEILSDVEYYIAREQYVKALDVLIVLWETILIVRKKSDTSDALVKYIDALEDQSKDLVDKIKSPQLIKKSYVELKKIALLSYYPVISPNNNLFLLLITHSHYLDYLADQSRDIIEYINIHLYKSIPLAQTYLRYLIDSNAPIANFEKISPVLRIQKIAKYALSSVYYSALVPKRKIELLALIRNYCEFEYDQKNIDKYSLDLYIQNGMYKNAFLFGINRYLSNGDLQGLSPLIDVEEVVLNQIISWMDQGVKDNKKVHGNLLIFFTLYYGQKHMIEGEIAKFGSLDLLSQLDHEKLMQLDVDLSKIYLSQIERFLEDYHGINAKNHVTKIVHRLLGLGLVSEHEIIMKGLQKMYLSQSSTHS